MNFVVLTPSKNTLTLNHIRLLIICSPQLHFVQSQASDYNKDIEAPRMGGDLLDSNKEVN